MDRLGVYLQVYNLGINAATRQPEATISYAILRGDRIVLNQLETTADLARAGEQITLQKRIALAELAPGDYQLKVTVTDWVRGQTIEPSAGFRIRP